MLLKNKRVFIVEDHLQSRVVTQMLLEQEGAVVAFDRWGRDTIKNLAAFAPVDIILLDLMLPGDITGFDIAQEILTLPDFAHIPLVALSAMSPSAAIPEAKRVGFKGFIAKPLEFHLFAKRIVQILDGQEVWQG